MDSSVSMVIIQFQVPQINQLIQNYSFFPSGLRCDFCFETVFRYRRRCFSSPLCVCVCVCVFTGVLTQSRPTLSKPVDCSLPGSLPVEVFRHEYWSGLPFPPPEGLPHPGVKPVSLVSPIASDGTLYHPFPLHHLGSPSFCSMGYFFVCFQLTITI